MTREFIDGFLAGDTALWDYVSASGVSIVTNIYGIRDVSDYQVYIDQASIIQKEVTPSDQYYVAFYWKPYSSPTYCKSIFSFWHGDILLGKLEWNATKNFELYRQNTLIATSPNEYNYGTYVYYLIEIAFKPHETLGFFQLKVNGNLEISYAGDTAPSPSPSISPSVSLSISPSASPSASISPSLSPSLSPSTSPSASLSPSLSPSPSPSQSPSASISPSVSPSVSPSEKDFQINIVQLGSEDADNTNAYFAVFRLDDSDWIGETFIQAVIPTNQGTTNDWDPSTGFNYQCVDEVPASDTDYIKTNALNEIDLFVCNDLTGDIANIYCVQVQARAVKVGDPIPQNLQLAVRSGGGNYFSGDKELSAVTPIPTFNPWSVNPATATSWTESTVNALEIGVKAVA